MSKKWLIRCYRRDRVKGYNGIVKNHKQNIKHAVFLTSVYRA